MTVLLLDRLARDIQRLCDLSPGPTASQGPHDVLCLEVVSEDSKGADGTKAVVGTEAINHGSAHGATLVAIWRKAQPKLLRSLELARRPL